MLIDNAKKTPSHSHHVWVRRGTVENVEQHIGKNCKHLTILCDKKSAFFPFKKCFFSRFCQRSPLSSVFAHIVFALNLRHLEALQINSFSVGRWDEHLLNCILKANVKVKWSYMDRKIRSKSNLFVALLLKSSDDKEQMRSVSFASIDEHWKLMTCIGVNLTGEQRRLSTMRQLHRFSGYFRSFLCFVLFSIWKNYRNLQAVLQSVPVAEILMAVLLNSIKDEVVFFLWDFVTCTIDWIYLTHFPIWLINWLRKTPKFHPSHTLFGTEQGSL